MKIKQITFGDDGDPSDVLVHLSRREALYLTLMLGGQSGNSANAVMAGGDVVSTELWDGFTGGLWNCFYEDGVREAAARELSGTEKETSDG